jgi:hypothetical protein
MKRFNDYTDTELLTLDNDTFNIAVRVEAIERGIKPPVPLSEALRTSEWKGYQHPGDAAAVWEIVRPDRYSSVEGSGVAYLTEAAALKAIEGAVSIRNETYGANQGFHFNSGQDWSVRRVPIGSMKSAQAWAKLEAYKEDTTEFDKVVEECTERWSRVLQADYNAKVQSERRAEYLRLADGNEEIAKAFWAKSERTDWPTA